MLGGDFVCFSFPFARPWQKPVNGGLSRLVGGFLLGFGALAAAEGASGKATYRCEAESAGTAEVRLEPTGLAGLSFMTVTVEPGLKGQGTWNSSGVATTSRNEKKGESQFALFAGHNRAYELKITASRRELAASHGNAQLVFRCSEASR